MNRKKNINIDTLTFFGFTIIPILLYSFFYVYSVLTGIIFSFTNWNGIDSEYDMIGLKNYFLLFNNKNFWNSLRVTFLYAIFLVIGVVSISLIIAISLNSIKKFQTFLKSVFFLPAMLGAITISLIWDQLFYRVIPLIGQELGIKILSQNLLSQKSTALLAVVFVNIWQSVAMPTLIFLASLQTIPEEMYESAKLDGADNFQCFKNITLPYIVPTITVNIVLAVKQGFTAFDYAYALTGGGPARATELVGILIYNDAFQNNRFGMANAEAIILFLFVACISIVQIFLTEKKGVNT